MSCHDEIRFTGLKADVVQYRSFLKSCAVKIGEHGAVTGELNALWSGLELPIGGMAKSGLNFAGTFTVPGYTGVKLPDGMVSGIVYADSVKTTCIEDFILVRDALSIPLKLEFCADNDARNYHVTSSYAFRPKYWITDFDRECVIGAKDDTACVSVMMSLFGDHGIDLKRYKALADEYAARSEHGFEVSEAEKFDMKAAERRVHDILMEY